MGNLLTVCVPQVCKYILNVNALKSLKLLMFCYKSEDHPLILILRKIVVLSVFISYSNTLQSQQLTPSTTIMLNNSDKNAFQLRKLINNYSCSVTVEWNHPIQMQNS